MSAPQALHAKSTASFIGAGGKPASLRRAACRAGSSSNRHRGKPVVINAKLITALASVLRIPVQKAEPQMKQLQMESPPPNFQDLDGENLRVRTVFISDVHLGASRPPVE